MIVRRLRLRRLAASEGESPSDLRHFAKSAPVMGCCSSAIRRNVVAETSSGPHFVGTGQATPSPPSMIAALAKVSVSPISGAKCLLRAISPVKSSSYSRRSLAKRTCRVRPPLARSFLTFATSSIISLTSEIRSIVQRVRLDAPESIVEPTLEHVWAHRRLEFHHSRCGSLQRNRRLLGEHEVGVNRRRGQIAADCDSKTLKALKLSLI